MKLNLAFLSTVLIFNSIPLAMSAEALAEKKAQTERWFEVEVILFKQLNNKSALKEQFPNNISTDSLPKYKQSFDLLTPYLQPNLTRIKKFAPQCGEKDEQQLFLASLQSVSTPFPEQIALIEQVPRFELPDFTKEPYINGQITTDEAINATTENAEQAFAENEQINKEQPEQVTPEIASEIAVLEPEAELEQELEPELEITTEFDFQQEDLDKPIFSTQDFCVIAKRDIESLFEQEQLAGFNLDAYGVESLPSKLNASGAHVSDSPYLIADDSLLLKDISKRLRWSKEFKPLLHFGWRQVGITQKKAIAVKLFAGEHLEYKYQQALKEHNAAVQAEIAEEKAIEENLLKQLAQAQTDDQVVSDQLINGISNQGIDDTRENQIDAQLALSLENKQQALNHLFYQLDELSNNPESNEVIEAIVNDTEKQSLDTILTANKVKTLEIGLLPNIIPPPQAPLQPWLLDGFFKVHLDHYLYITADFNVVNKNTVAIEHKGDKSKREDDDLKLINFSQTRRVITGEVHYFDHPYIGMIVQIRRFDPTKPADEAVTQAIK